MSLVKQKKGKIMDFKRMFGRGNPDHEHPLKDANPLEAIEDKLKRMQTMLNKEVTVHTEGLTFSGVLRYIQGDRDCLVGEMTVLLQEIESIELAKK
jgi:hypothetical protein